jgi:hypothetical protein
MHCAFGGTVARDKRRRVRFTVKTPAGCAMIVVGSPRAIGELLINGANSANRNAHGSPSNHRVG